MSKLELVKFTIKWAFISIILITLGVVGLILYFNSDKEIKYVETGIKELEVGK